MATNKQIVDALDEVARTSDELETELGRLRKLTYQNRMRIRLLVASVIFDVLLSVGLGVLAITTRNTAVEARAATTASRIAHNNLQVICESTNETNKVQKGLWESILALPPQEPETPEQVKQREDFRVLMNKTFAKKDCNEQGG